MSDLFGDSTEKIRTIGFYQPFCSLMLHGKIETRWVRVGRFAPFPMGKYIGYSTKKECTTEQIMDWSGIEISNLILKTLHREETKSMNGFALWVGDLIKIGTMYPYQERECFVKHKLIQSRLNKQGIRHDYYQNCLYFENVQRIEPFEFKFGKQGVGIFPESQNHLIKIKI